MPRQPRIEFDGAIYHVINRGNYRRDVFATDGAKDALLRALDETATKLGWKIFAWVIMSNHFHVALETPRGNLVEGMKVWQGTFATRFNRLRSERGHIFQGRYRSQVVEGSDYLGALCHYIHLNPVRAKMCSVDELTRWPWSSFRWVMQPKGRPDWFDPTEALQNAGDLPDRKPGHRAYQDYLSFLATDDHAQKELKFDQMCHDWVLGSVAFKKALIEDREELRDSLATSRHAMGSDSHRAWTEQLQNHLKKARITSQKISRSAKSAEWKVAVAAAMKAETTVTNRWLAERLNMGGLHEVSRLVNRWKKTNP